MRIAIIGAAELGRLIASHAVSDANLEVIGFYDDFKEISSYLNFPLLGKTDSIVEDYKNKKFDAIMIGIGYNKMEARASLFNRFKGQIPFANIVHSSSYVDKSCKLGEGVFILPGVIVDLDVIIEDNVLINTGTIIAHHTKIGRHSFIAPGVHIAGLVNIGEECFIGIGAIVKDCITINNRSVIGAGSLVLKDTEENSISIGSPAKFLKYNT